MNRKLQHTLQALTASVAVFGLLLLAGGPPTATPAAPAVLVASADLGEADPAQAVEATEAVESHTTGRVRRNHRAVLAMPYFSFAKGGLRRVAGS